MTPHIACSKYERFCDFKPIRSASPINGRWIDALILWRNVYPYANILMQRCTVRSRWCSSNLPRLLPLARRCNQSCWSRRQKNSTITSTSFSSSRKPSTSSSTSFNSPRKGSPRPSTRYSSPRHPLAENEYSIAGHWIDGQNTEHRTLVLWRWRRWLQALGLFYKKNMPNNNTALFNL